MGGTWVTDLTHFLTDDGAIGPKSGPARKLAEYLTKIVLEATDPDRAAVRCRRRPKRKPCAGEIETDIDPDTDAIIWWCSVCEDNGIISNWQGSHWDRTAVARSQWRR